MTPRLEAILRYHQHSTHRLQAYARGPAGLDWKSQPEPFRRFAGAPMTLLPLAADTLTPCFADLQVPGGIPPRPFDLDAVAQLFELSLAISAWKELGETRWALRCNPSSGNLHPTEAYLACPALPGLKAGVYHYQAHTHALERRAALAEPGGWEFGSPGVLVGLTSVHWREAWKYGGRAYRYSELDLGHAVAAVRYAAATLGWQARVLSEAGDDELAQLLGLARDPDFAGAERERPEALLWVDAGAPAPSIQALNAALQTATWSGKAGSPGVKHPRWDEIDQVADAATRQRSECQPWQPPPLPPRHPPAPPESMSPGGRPCASRPVASPLERSPAALLIRGRRSALAFDAQTRIPAARFFSMLESLLPRAAVPPCDALPWEPCVHPFFFVHRVKGLPMGLYALGRSKSAQAQLAGATRDEFIWQPAEGAPEHLPLFLLLPLDLRRVCQELACHQALAAEGAFTAAFVAQWRSILEVDPSGYRRLHWEAGLLGQALYLEAEAAGVRATGIGCFFDEEVHRLLGLTDDRFRALYLQAVGGPVEDLRLTPLPPYRDRR